MPASRGRRGRAGVGPGPDGNRLRTSTTMEQDVEDDLHRSPPGPVDPHSSPLRKENPTREDVEKNPTRDGLPAGRSGHVRLPSAGHQRLALD